MCGIGGILGSVSQDKINYITHDMKNLRIIVAQTEMGLLF